jgi:AraC-like DNA-binding protein
MLNEMEIETQKVRRDKDIVYSGSFIDKEYVLHVILSGSFTYQVNNRMYQIAENSLILIEPNNLHALTRLVDVDMVVVHFYDLSHSLDNLVLNDITVLPPELIPEINHLVRLLVKIWTKHREASKEIINGLVHTLIGYFISISSNAAEIQTEVPGQVNYHVFSKAIRYILQEFKRPNLTIKEISMEAGLSYNYFCSQFKEFTNETPLHFLNRTRVEYSKEILFNKKMNIAETAHQSGFLRPQQYCKVFRRMENMSPSDWLHKIDQCK